jgi:hypothetical protein
MTVLPLSGVSCQYETYRMNTFLELMALVILFSLLGGPALVGAIHDRRIDRQLREAERKTQKSSSRSTVPSTATWYAEGRRSKKLVSS